MAGVAVGVVAVHAFNLDRHAVDQQFHAVELHFAETHIDAHNFQHYAVLAVKREQQRVERRGLRRPLGGGGHSDVGVQRGAAELGLGGYLFGSHCFPFAVIKCGRYFDLAALR